MSQELNTILAALRYYQENGQGEPANRSDAIHDLATDNDTDISMDAAGIDELCARLNCGVSLWIYIRVYLRPENHPKGGPQPAFTHTFIQAGDEDTAYLLGNREPFDAALQADGYLPANDYAVQCGPLLQPAHIDLLEPMEKIAEIVKEALG